MKSAGSRSRFALQVAIASPMRSRSTPVPSPPPVKLWPGTGASARGGVARGAERNATARYDAATVSRAAEMRMTGRGKRDEDGAGSVATIGRAPVGSLAAMGPTDLDGPAGHQARA